MLDEVKFKQFLADVHTAAGLLYHGRTDKGLASRLSKQVMEYYEHVSENQLKEMI